MAVATPAAASRPDGWLIDITESDDGRSVVLWTKEPRTGRVRRTAVEYRPPFLVTGTRNDLALLARRLVDHPDVESVALGSGRPSLYDRRNRPVLSVVPSRNPARRPLARAVDALGGYERFSLYDVDLGPPQLYHLAHDLYPFAPVVGRAPALTATEPPETIDYATPPLKVVPLEVHLAGERRGRIPPPDARIGAVRLDDVTLEGPEEELLRALVGEVARIDPDVLLTEGGDAFDLPWLYRRAEACRLSPAVFSLGRERVRFRPSRPARSFESYGRILHRDAFYPLPGRFHIDRENSFLYRDAELAGLVDAARLSRLSLTTVVRQSPGTCFTAMEMAHALELGAHVPWKKNRPEGFRRADRLVAADRGGVIFLPPVGVHDHVDEFDFASLYPHIMVTKNLSAETLECRCCPASPVRAPGLGYRSCTRRRGLIPRTLAPLLERRLAYKAALKRPGLAPEEAVRLKRRVKMLKWILVTAFGYQGYRNARFGRIECHEAINAYARELIARLVPEAERTGYSVVHGIVDSLWLRPVDVAHPPDPEAFARRVSGTVGMPLGYEGRYRWIVFLPAVTHGLGVPNRYFGYYEHGEFKLRGIGARRHDTTGLVRRFEAEVLALLRTARDAEGVRALVPRVLARADLFAEEVRAGTWPVDELLIAHRIGQAPEAFVTFTDSVAALRQLQEAGATRGPGEVVRYVLLDRRSRSFRDRVRPAELLVGDERYDIDGYLDLLARSAETLLAALGVDREALRTRWSVAPAPEREEYRSPEELHQSRLGPLAPDGSY
ncbi:MAG TPA: DNA polymerase domain-containing protein [Thermoplasmata archaeon]|nr:DNA polymerase domain-containing protein [Thermoplasmata archaeon]